MSDFLAGVKTRAPTFNRDAVCDNTNRMRPQSQSFDPGHPLLADKDRLDKILDVMYAKIQRTLFPWRNPQRRLRPETSPSSDADGVERILKGTGVSADDVLGEAFLALFEYPQERLEGTWEGLAVTIAGNKAVDALRASGKGLRGTDHRPELRLVSGDTEREGPDGEAEPSIFEVTPSDWGDPEAEYLKMEAVLKLRDLARELLDARDRSVFFAIHFGDFTRREVGEWLGLTSQRIGQIYKTALLTLESHFDYPFKPPIPVGQMRGGGTDD